MNDDDVMRAILDAIEKFNIATASDTDFDALCSAKEALENALDAIGAALALRKRETTP
jgi:hypothetical protein